MRIIDADALLKGHEDHEMISTHLIWNVPTIDAVEVVRCKDCKHNPKYTDDYMYGRCVFCCEDDYYSGAPSDDFYCGYGERKETDYETD